MVGRGAAPDRRRPSEAEPQTRWSRLGVWERLLAMAQARGVALGMACVDGPPIRAQQKAAPGVAPIKPDMRLGLLTARR